MSMLKRGLFSELFHAVEILQYGDDIGGVTPRERRGADLCPRLRIELFGECSRGLRVAHHPAEDVANADEVGFALRTRDEIFSVPECRDKPRIPRRYGVDAVVVVVLKARNAAATDAVTQCAHSIFKRAFETLIIGRQYTERKYTEHARGVECRVAGDAIFVFG